ncbi:Uncharacterised protein [Mycobacteroides abscessus subsp. abscessus]|nr:Uncharacterised protein [Mycobacteroides abscessus subsp. abscessus]
MFGGVSDRTENLKSSPGCQVRGVGRRDLGRGDVTAHVDALGNPTVDADRCTVDEWAGHLDGDRDVGEVMLDRLERSDLTPELLA